MTVARAVSLTCFRMRPAKYSEAPMQCFHSMGRYHYTTTGSGTGVGGPASRLFSPHGSTPEYPRLVMRQPMPLAGRHGHLSVAAPKSRSGRTVSLICIRRRVPAAVFIIIKLRVKPNSRESNGTYSGKLQYPKAIIIR